METRLDALEARLRAAERQARAQRGLLLGVTVIGAALLFVKPGITEGTGSTVKAPFSVVDGEGKTVLMVGSGEKGPGLALYGKEGKIVSLLGAPTEGGILLLANKDGDTRTALSASDEPGRLFAYNAAGSIVARLRVNERTVGLGLESGTGNGSVTLGVINESGALTLNGKDDSNASIGTFEGEGSLILSCQSGKTLLSTGKKDSILQMFRNGKSVRAALLATDERGQFGLFDSSGKMISTGPEE